MTLNRKSIIYTDQKHFSEITEIEPETSIEVINVADIDIFSLSLDILNNISQNLDIKLLFDDDFVEKIKNIISNKINNIFEKKENNVEKNNDNNLVDKIEKLLIAGKNVKEIAEELNISVGYIYSKVRIKKIKKNKNFNEVPALNKEIIEQYKKELLEWEQNKEINILFEKPKPQKPALVWVPDNDEPYLNRIPQFCNINKNNHFQYYPGEIETENDWPENVKASDEPGKGWIFSSIDDGISLATIHYPDIIPAHGTENGISYWNNTQIRAAFYEDIKLFWSWEKIYRNNLLIIMKAIAYENSINKIIEFCAGYEDIILTDIKDFKQSLINKWHPLLNKEIYRDICPLDFVSSDEEIERKERNI